MLLKIWKKKPLLGDLLNFKPRFVAKFCSATCPLAESEISSFKTNKNLVLERDYSRFEQAFRRLLGIPTFAA